MATVQVPRYPLDKNESGNAAWKVLHNFAAQYPDKPMAEDKREFHSLLKSVLRTIPDSDCKCRTHAVEYIHKNPPTMNSRKELVEYVCNFHNSVNQRSAKPVIDCKLLLESTAECESCKVLPKKVVEAADVDGPLKQTLGDYKKLSVKVIEELCKREGLPVPRVVFAPCPTAQQTSCNIMIKDENDVVIKENKDAPIVYLNPTNFGLRVLIHEWNEYQRQMKNAGRYLPKDEEAVERHTQEIIQKYFPKDEYDKEAEKLTIAPLVMRDEVSSSNTSVPTSIPEPPSQTKQQEETGSEKKINSFLKRETTLRGRNAFATYNDFPILSKYRADKERVQMEQEKVDSEGGILSHLDGLFEPIAKFMNIKARDVNMATTPTIFSEGSQLAIRSQFSEFGSLIITSVLGLGLAAVTAFNKDNISISDRRMLTQLAGLYIWSGLRSANSEEVILDAREVGSTLANLDFASLPALMVNRGSFLASFVGEETDSKEQQVKGVQKRREQRKQGRGSGARIGGGLSRGGGGPGFGVLGGGGEETEAGMHGGEGGRGRGRERRFDVPEQVIERVRQRAAGEGRPPEDIGTFRDFPSNARPRQQPSVGSPSPGYGGPGVAAVRSDSSGGAGFTYVPTVSPSALSNDERDLLEAMGYPTEASSSYPARFYYDNDEDLV